jgi:tight adherence protein C
MLLLLTTLLIFAAVATAAYGLYQVAIADRNPVTLRLRQLRRLHPTTTDVSYAGRRPLLRNLVAALGGFLPSREGGDALRTGLVRAGFRRADSLLVFMGTKVLLAAALPVSWGALAWTLGRPAGNVLLQSLLLGVAGFYLPTLWLAWRAGQRRADMQGSLPDALDLMVVCVEAGLGLGQAIQRVGQEIELASPALAEELGLVNQEMLAGVSRTDALRHLAERTGIEDIYSLVAMLIHTDRLGTSIAQSLRAHADSMRTRRRQRAEQQARKAGIKMAFPLVFLILPALLVVILGPAAIQLLKAIAAQQ